MAGEDNILRVGAEFDVSQIIEGAQEAVASIDALSEVYAQLSDLAASTGDSVLQNAAAFMQDGLSAADAVQNLMRFGATQQQAEAAVKQVTDAIAAQVPTLAAQSAATSVSTSTTQAQTTATTQNVTATQSKTAATTANISPTIAQAAATQTATAAQAGQTGASAAAASQIAALQAQINALNQALQQLQQQLANTTTRTSGMTGAMGAARVEAGALTGSTGMMVGGLARVAAQSAALAPIIQAAFPVFAILAFIAILDAAIKKLEEWADIARKSADAQAEFDISIQKSFDTMEQSRQHLAGLASSNAELAEKMRTSGEKTIDLVESVKKLNERVADSDGYFKRLKEGLGIVTIAIEENIGIIDKSERDLQLWNSRIAETYKQAKDLTPAIREVTEQIKELQAAGQELPTGSRELRENQRKISEQTEFYNLLISKQGEFVLQQKSLQIESDQKLLEEHEKVVKARASFDESQARAELRAHAITLEQERTQLLEAEAERTRAEEAIIDSRMTLLRKQYSEQLISEQALTAGIRQLSEERAAVSIASDTRRAEITNSTDQTILRRTIEVGEARIKAEHDVSESLAKLDEDRAKRAFKEADTISEISSTATALTEKETAAYEDQIRKLQERAALLESTFVVLKSSGALGQAITADLGTDQFKKQLEEIKTIYPELYKQLVEFDAQVRVLQTKEADEHERTAREEADRIKKIHAEELEDSIRAEQENLTRIQSLYQEDIAHLQELHDQKKLTLREYTQAAIMFAEEEFNARKATLIEEMNALKEARAQDYITEEEYHRKVIQLEVELAKFQEEKEKEVTNFQKAEIAKREQQMQESVTKITNEFIQGIDKMILKQGDLGRTAAQMAQQIELNLINKGIERVAIKYGEQFAKIIADHLKFITDFISEHSTFLATLLGIETTSNATKLAKTIASNTAQISSDAGVSYAAGFMSVMEALPFPENVATAPGVAAAAAAQTELGLVFERGGIVDATLHHGEMVLPERISTAIQGAIPAISHFNRISGNVDFSATTRAAYSDVTNHYNMPITVNQAHGKTTAQEIREAVRQGIRTGHL